MAGFSERLRSLRAENRLIQSDLAKILEVTEATISYYESGRSEPNIGVVKKLSDFFNVSLDYMIGTSDYRKTEVSLDQFVAPLEIALREYMKYLSPKDQTDIAEYIEFKAMKAIGIKADIGKLIKKGSASDNRIGSHKY